MTAVDLGDYVESLTREVRPPDSTLFSSVDDDAWIGYLTDAFWQARLDGFMPNYSCDEDGLITPTTGTIDLPREYVALVVLYAGVRILRNQILNTRTSFHAKAGTVEFEQQNSATMLAEMLKQLAASKTQLIVQLQEQTPVYAFDTLVQRVINGYFFPSPLSFPNPLPLTGG